jgi:hypothetical protein
MFKNFKIRFLPINGCVCYLYLFHIACLSYDLLTFSVSGSKVQAPGSWLLVSVYWQLAAGARQMIPCFLPVARSEKPAAG